jgi:hypothetical protein
MAIFLEPSRDIHITLDHPAPQLRIRVLQQGFVSATNRFTYTEVTQSCQFDYFAPGPPQAGDPPDRKYSSIAQDGMVTAIARGVNLVQVSLPGTPPTYLIARIEVHSTMNGWWLGNASITTALDTVAHSQVSIYALFDFNAAEGPNSGVPADITGHGYVNLASGNEGIFQLDLDRRGFIRGIQENQENTAQLTASFMGKTETINVRVVNYDTQRPLERVDHNGPVDRKFNILFLSEGFTAAERAQFDEAVEKVNSRLFEASRHSPYNRLKKSFNVWKVFVPSKERGITCGHDLTSAGKPIPFDIEKRGILPDFVEDVGLPSRKEASMPPDDLRSMWKELHSKEKLVDYSEAQAKKEGLVEAWKTLIPHSKPQAKDTFFGMYYGSRWGDPLSRDNDPDNHPIVTSITAIANPKLYQRRMFEWFQPPLVTRLVTPDPRRRAREAQPRDYPLMRFIGGLVDSSVPVGQLWIPQAGTFMRNQGLVCLLVNDEAHGGANFQRLFTTVTLGRQDESFTNLNVSETATPVRVRRLTRNPSVEPNFDGVTDVAAHEFGHTFNLADEYEEFPRAAPTLPAPPQPPPPEIPRGDNIVRADEIRLVEAPLNPAQPLPIDAARVKWFDLHRMERSDAIVEPSQPNGSQLRLRLGPRRAKRWKTAKDEGTDVYLRSLNIRTNPEQPLEVGAQLPMIHDDNNFIVRVKVIDVNEADDTVTLGGDEMPIPPPEMPVGSVLFIPKINNEQFVFVVERPVLTFMTNLQVPLTENHNATHPSGFDELQEAPDNAPGNISGFHYPSNPFNVVGLYEGAGRYVGGVYRPAGACKMRSQDATGDEGSFCFVCKYLIVNRVDASQHDELDKCEYPEDC